MSYALLDGLRVVESSAFIAAPLAGLTLAQCGADVIHIDMIGGGIDYGRMPRMPSAVGRGRSLYWTALNKGKRSIAIDLRHPEGRELVQQLVAAPGKDAGVLLTNLGTPWLTHELLAALRADVISCTILGNGDGSTAVDYTVNCATGYPTITGEGSKHPVNHVLPAWDVACAHHAAFAIMAAVNRRLRTGQGSEIRLALSDIAFSTLSHLGILAETELLGQERPAIGNYLYGAFGRDFVTADGHRLMVVAISLGQWRSLVQACGMAEGIAEIEAQTGLNLADEAQRFAARERIAQIIDAWFAQRSRAQVEEELRAHKVMFGPYQSVADLLASDPRVSMQNPVFERMQTVGVGEHISAGAAIQLPGTPRQPMQPAPLLGTHTDEILQDVLGLDSATVGRLHDDGVVAGPDCDPTKE